MDENLFRTASTILATIYLELVKDSFRSMIAKRVKRGSSGVAVKLTYRFFVGDQPCPREHVVKTSVLFSCLKNRAHYYQGGS